MTNKLISFWFCFVLIISLISCNAEEKKDSSSKKDTDKSAEVKTENVVIPKSIQWTESYESALQKAKETSKPIMIDFYANWCGWCKKLDKITYTDTTVIRLSMNFINLKIDTERQRSIAQKYRIQSLPTIMFLDSDGTILDVVFGYSDPKQFATRMSNVLKSKVNVKAMKESADKNPKDAKLNYELAKSYIDNGNYNSAVPYLDKVIQSDPQNKNGYTDDAQLDLGICYANNKEFQLASEQFQYYIKTYPNGDRIDESHLYLGITFYLLNQKDSAIIELETLVNKYPNSKYKDKALMIIEKIKEY